MKLGRKSVERSKEMRSMKKRASLLGVVLSLAAIVALSVAVGVSRAGDGGGGGLILEVVVDFDTLEFPVGIPGPFNIQGTVEGGGTFQCWGWWSDDEFGTTNVSQVYDTGRGVIMTQGRETEEGEPLAIVGGTGDFRNVRGQGFVEFNDEGFTIRFEMRGGG